MSKKQSFKITLSYVTPGGKPVKDSWEEFAYSPLKAMLKAAKSYRKLKWPVQVRKNGQNTYLLVDGRITIDIQNEEFEHEK